MSDNITTKVIEVSNYITDMFAGNCTISDQGGGVYKVTCSSAHNLARQEDIEIETHPSVTIDVPDVVTLYQSPVTASSFRCQFHVLEVLSTTEFTVDLALCVPRKTPPSSIPLTVNRFKSQTGHTQNRFTSEYIQRNRASALKLAELPAHVVLEAGHAKSNRGDVFANGSIRFDGYELALMLIEAIANHPDDDGNIDNSIAELKARLFLSNRMQTIIEALKFKGWNKWDTLYGFSDYRKTVRQGIIFTTNC